jgi:hypothetical protein
MTITEVIGTDISHEGSRASSPPRGMRIVPSFLEGREMSRKPGNVSKAGKSFRKPGSHFESREVISKAGGQQICKTKKKKTMIDYNYSLISVHIL